MIYRASLADFPHSAPVARASQIPLCDRVPRDRVLAAQREWIQAVIEAGGFYSLGDGDEPASVFQVIRLPGALRASHGTRVSSDEMRLQCDVLLFQGLPDFRDGPPAAPRHEGAGAKKKHAPSRSCPVLNLCMEFPQLES
jgi:hypothetical protein